MRLPAPIASRRTHVLAAGLMWALVGLGLMAAGFRWATQGHSRLAVPALLGAAVVGLFKARLILDRSAARILRRIEVRGDDRCLGGFLSWKSWLVVMAMIALGRLLRASPVPLLWRGVLYFAIGMALLVASRGIWRRWWGMRPAGGPV